MKQQEKLSLPIVLVLLSMAGLMVYGSYDSIGGPKVVALEAHAAHCPGPGVIECTVSGGHTSYTKDGANEGSKLTKFTLVAGNIETPMHLPFSYLDWDTTEWKGGKGAYLWLKMLWPSLANTPIRFGVINKGQFDAQEDLLESGTAFRIEFVQRQTEGMKYLIDRHIEDNWIPFEGSPSAPGFQTYVEKL